MGVDFVRVDLVGLTPSCDNSGVSVCIVATGYMKVPLLQVDIAIPEDGHF